MPNISFTADLVKLYQVQVEILNQNHIANIQDLERVYTVS